jgi:hypothetical protein
VSAAQVVFVAKGGKTWYTMRARAVYEILDEIHQPDRRALDVLGLTQGEREAVYEAVLELGRKRLEKARSG